MPNSLLAPSPLLKDEPASGLDCSGISKPRRISVKAGRQQVRLCTADTAKGQGRRELGAGTGRGGRARTCDNRFWRPVLYQLSYTPIGTKRRSEPSLAADPPFQA